jgi:ABC-2 type transport system ATP-binding protein
VQLGPAIEVEDVSKRFRLYHERNQSLKATIMRRGRAKYDELWALKDVSLKIPKDTTFGLIGENGSGKSTLLKCMARILRPDSGRISLAGKVSALLELGAGFHPELSGRENVYLNGSILGLGKKEIDRKFDEIVDFAGIERFIDTPVKNYSSGMYVRLGFSVAINVDPDILLVDEVLAVGDEQFQRRCAEKFADLKAAGKTIVIVSHSLGAVRSMCDQIAWLEHGSLRRIGPASEVIDEYLGDVSNEREEGVGVGSRWGSGEGRIEDIELLDAQARPVTKVRTGDAVTLRFHYRTSQLIPQPVFGMAIHTLEGIHVTGPNTREAGCVPEHIDGSGTVDLVISPLLLLPGTYDVSAALVDHSALHIFDFRHRALRFDVDPGTPHETYGGVVSLAGTWRVDAMDRLQNAEQR